ncbi:MAG: hypothetical protein ACI4RE_05750, partial [Christensenellales bacterium]
EHFIGNEEVGSSNLLISSSKESRLCSLLFYAFLHVGAAFRAERSVFHCRLPSSVHKITIVCRLLLL